MLSAIKTYLANQARKPSGWFGRIVAPRVFENTNKHMENFGLELMDPDEKDHILEIGFGSGRLISEIVPMVEKGKVCGIDLSDEMVEVAARNNAKWVSNGKLEIQKASIEEIPYPDHCFDKVFTCNTLYFWPEPLENIREVKRVLNPNGQFFCAFRDKELMESKSSAVTDNRDIFENLYQPEDVRQLFREGGFEDVALHKNCHNSEKFYIAVGHKK
jgi:SAM-dependent methyltransferase